MNTDSLICDKEKTCRKNLFLSDNNINIYSKPFNKDNSIINNLYNNQKKSFNNLSKKDTDTLLGLNNEKCKDNVLKK